MGDPMKRTLPCPGMLTMIALAAVLSFSALGCRKDAPSDAETVVVPVELMTVVAAELEETTKLTGVLQAYRAVDIVSEVSGEITKLHCDVGSAVGRGVVLTSLEKDVLQEVLNQADAALLAAQAQFELAERDFGRDSSLFEHGDIAEAAFDASQLAYRAASAECDGARARRALAARDLRQADIRAPYSGVISRRYGELGMFVAPGTPLFRIVNIDSLRLVLGVAQRDIARLSPGGEVTITAEAFGSRSFKGRIRSIPPEADKATRTFPVEVILPNPDGQPLRDGLVVRASLVLGLLEAAVAIPREAVLQRLGGYFVFVVAAKAASDSTGGDGVAHQRSVKLGALIGDRYTIDQGLEAGERLVVVGMQNLLEGTPVSIERVHPNGLYPAQSDDPHMGDEM